VVIVAIADLVDTWKRSFSFVPMEPQPTGQGGNQVAEHGGDHGYHPALQTHSLAATTITSKRYWNLIAIRQFLTLRVLLTLTHMLCC
jgi:hypothetical protein